MEYTLDSNYILIIVDEAKYLTKDVKDLIRKILVPADERLTLDQILKHPWMTKSLGTEPINLDLKRLKNFTSFSKVDHI